MAAVVEVVVRHFGPHGYRFTDDGSLRDPHQPVAKAATGTATLVTSMHPNVTVCRRRRERASVPPRCVSAVARRGRPIVADQRLPGPLPLRVGRYATFERCARERPAVRVGDVQSRRRRIAQSGRFRVRGRRKNAGAPLVAGTISRSIVPASECLQDGREPVALPLLLQHDSHPVAPIGRVRILHAPCADGTGSELPDFRGSQIGRAHV